jgi:hypothetical protein
MSSKEKDFTRNAGYSRIVLDSSMEYLDYMDRIDN